jgi:hypothetical protein
VIHTGVDDMCHVQPKSSLWYELCSGDSLAYSTALEVEGLHKKIEYQERELTELKATVEALHSKTDRPPPTAIPVVEPPPSMPPVQ